MLMLIILAVLLYTQCDYSLLQPQRTSSRFLAAPPNSKLTLEAELGIQFTVNSSPLMMMSSDGNIGIGITNPSQKLHVNPGRLLLSGDTAGVYLKDTNRGIIYSKVPNGAQSFTTSAPKDGLALYGYLDGCLGTTDITNGGAKSVLAWTSSGAVTINPPSTATTNYPLAVYGYTSVARSSSYIYVNDPATVGATDFRTSIYCQYGVVSGAYGFMTLSDERIKKNIQPSQNSLSVIDKIQVVRYEHIDRDKEGLVEFGVLAQQLKECVPTAVRQTSEWIPNVYQKVQKAIKVGVTVSLFFEERVPDISGKLLRLIGKKDILVRVLSQGTHSLIVDEFPIEEELFAYGSREDDFLVVDKQQLAVLAIQGVKELMQEVRELRQLVQNK